MECDSGDVGVMVVVCLQGKREEGEEWFDWEFDWGVLLIKNGRVWFWARVRLRKWARKG